MKYVARPLLVALILGTAPWAAGQEAKLLEPAAPDKVSVKVRQLMQDREYAAAIEAIDEAAAAKGAPKDYLTYLKGRALHLQNKYVEAGKVFDLLLKDHPKSPWARRARFAKALSLMRLGDFRNAEEIYRKEAEYLLSTARKGEIADMYLEFADTYFKPPKDENKPDYNKALTFYQQALKVGAKPDRRLEVELLVGQCYQKLGKHGEAAREYQAFLNEHAKSRFDVEARFRLGEVQLAQGDLVAARRTWEDLLAAHPKSEDARIPEALYNISRTFHVPQPPSDEDLARGVAALETFLKQFPTHKLASEAHLKIAQSYMHRGRDDEAVNSLKAFLADKRYADSDQAPTARQLLGRAYQVQKKFTEALAAWREYLAKHPAHESWAAVQTNVITTEYLMAYEQRLEKKYAQARKLWEAFLVKYPLDQRARGILFAFGQMNYEQKQWEAALADWRRLVSKYPGTGESSRGQYMIAYTLETQQTKFEDAIKEYKKVTWGPYAGKAQQRIALLSAKQMSIATTRVFRSGETPTIKLTSRNIEEVTVEVYTVDLETYFRKMHHAHTVGALDIALIDPDKQFTFKLPDYVKHKELEREIEVPVPMGDAKKKDAAASGVMAVTVSSKTLEATTLVLQSDLDILVKSSRDEVFVFAENMRTGKPWPGARLLISTGDQVIAEGKSGPDGVFKSSYKELKTAGDVRVFAIADKHVASNVVALSGIGVAQGLSDRAYIFTDRPAYRPGQVVHVRGILRQAKDDNYTFAAGRKYTVDVVDARDRVIWQKEIALGKFGSLHANFAVPTGSPQGYYRVRVYDKEGHVYEGSFQVHEYQLQPVQLAVDTERTVFYRGEEITGKITAKFYYGAPLVGREIRYQLGGGRVHTAKTNDAGQVDIKLPTRELRETQIIPLVVTLPERSLQYTKNLVLATQGFMLDVTTVRGVYLQDETFEVRVKATDAEGKPIEQKLKLNVLQRTKVDGQIGERSVESHDITTDKEGVARQTLRLKEGGVYILRAEGTDRFENAVIGGGLVKISDDKDTVRLRILADKHTFKVGDEPAVQLHWREDPALALITYEGARVLDYRLVQLKKGLNKLPVPMTANLAPNFELAVAVMTDARAGKDDKTPPRRFHAASSPFFVQRDLKVSIETKRKAGAKGPIRPGEELDVVITTTDASGKAVSAEVSLAMVERSLLDRYGSAAGIISDFFRGQPRQPAFRTTSSVSFRCAPSTKPIDPELLKESDRIELAKEIQLRAQAAAALAAQDAEDAEKNANNNAKEAIEQLNKLEPAEPDMPRGEGRNDFFEQMGGESFGYGAFGPGGSSNPKARLHDYLKRAQDQQSPGRQMAGQQPGDGAPAANDPNDWGKLGSAGRIFPFESNLSLEIGQNQTVGNIIQIDGSRINDLQKAHDTITLLYKDGKQRELNIAQLGDVNAGPARMLIAQLGKEGAALLAAAGASETGYWNPAVVTDAKGRATLKITVPDRSTGWKLTARGITAETLAGEAESELTAKKDLFGELKLPLAFTDGDKARVIVSVHNDSLAKGQITVSLKTTMGDEALTKTKNVDVARKGVHEVEFDVTLARPEGKANGPAVSAEFELTVSAGGARDVVKRSVPIRPDGMPVFVTASGSAQSDITAFIEPPKDIAIEAPSLQIVIGPTVERSLLDIVLGPAPPIQICGCRYASGLERSTSDLMASLALQNLLKTTRQAGGPEAAALDAAIRSAVSLLISSQDKGGWSWTGRGGATNRYASARATWALSLAKQAGYPVPDDVLAAAAGYLTGQIAATGNTDYESKSVLLHALSVAGRGDFTLANRLFRARQGLSDAALAYLALALVEMDRESMADELLKILATHNMDKPAQRVSVSWNAAVTETRAIYALAAQGVPAQAAKARELVTWLMAHRSGNRWSPEKATGPAALAAAAHFAKNQFKREHYKLEIVVNKVPVKTLDIGDETGTQTIDVPANFLEKGKIQNIRFRLTGRGRFSYQCIYGGFVPTDKLKSTTDQWTIARTYEPANLEVDGEAIPRGFGDVLVGTYKPFRNPLTQLPVGKRGHIELRLTRRFQNSRAEGREYLVITEPLPSGTTVIEQSISGDYERYEISPGEITFYVGSRHGGAIHYDVHGYLPGAYRAGPTVVRDAYRLDDLAVATAKQLAVLPLGAKSADKYDLSPLELYELGRRHFAKKEYKQAAKHLTELFNNWKLKPHLYQNVARMLLETHLEIGPAKAIVNYFEINIEKWPEREIPLQMITKVGAAYHETGEYERSFLVFRAGVEASFARDSQVGGFLEGEQEFLRSIRVMDRLLAEYPPEPYVAASRYALAQRIYAKAATAHDDPKLREKKVLSPDVVRQALSMLNNFLTAYPEDPAADQASFSVGVALLELKAYEQAIAACERFATRYPGSDFLDSYWYTIGYAHFALGQHKQALEMCRRVADHKRLDGRSGREFESKNKWESIYIMGQVHHSLGKAAAAIREYTRVKERFPDAKQAIEYFAHKEIKLPEVTSVQPGKPAVVNLTFRNVPACDTRVYRIDLMKFTLLRRNLDNITKINLAGIRPLYEAETKLGDGKDYRDRKHELKLPLKKEGAYLVVSRGGNLHTSGLVLVTPLKVDVQEDAQSGRVRATVKDTAADKFLHDVHVKVIGSHNGDFVSGETDLRGVFVADAICGTSTIVARADGGRYAFFRGKTHLGPTPQPNAPAQAAPRKGKGKGEGKGSGQGKGGKKGLLDNLNRGNSELQREQQQELDNLYKKKPEGVPGGGFF